MIYHDQPLNFSITGNDNEQLPSKEDLKNHDDPNDQKRHNNQNEYKSHEGYYNVADI